MDKEEKVRTSAYPEHLMWVDQYKCNDCWGDIYVVVPDGYDVQKGTVEEHINSFANNCRMCASPLHELRAESSEESDEIWNKRESFSIKGCERCGWWYGIYKWNSSLHEADAEVIRTTQLFEGIVKKFDLSGLEVPNDILRRHLERHIDDVIHLNPTKFELLLRDVYRDFFDCEVRHVGGPGDDGVDLFAIINDEPRLVQVKRRQRPEHVEGAATVREFIGTLIAQDIGRGHIVTTANHFSPPARQLAANPNLGRHSIEIELKAIDEVYRMLCISNNRIGQPWDMCRRGTEGLPEDRKIHNWNKWKTAT